MTTNDLVARLQDRQEEMLAALRELVDAESPSTDPAAVAHCASVVSTLGSRLLGAEPETVVTDGWTHVRWRFGTVTRVLLCGHIDTVWPLGTIAARPFDVRDGIVTGPGVFDMKAGAVQLLFALSMLDDLDGVTVVLTTDEELGSPASRPLMRESAIGARAALVLEPSEAGALKTARKGVSLYRLEVVGRAAHAGLEPEKGINASIELAHQAIAIAALNGLSDGTTVTPTMMRAGTSTNSVPELATLDIDVRTFTLEEEAAVGVELNALEPVTPGASLKVEKIGSFPPLDRASSEQLFERARKVGRRLGLGSIHETAVGGGSDGSVIASYGVPTLDGLGPVGGGAHSPHEHVIAASLPERAALVAELTRELLEEGSV